LKVYEDLIDVGDNEQDKAEFCRVAVNEFKASQQYREAADAEMYYSKHNATIERYVKKITTATGREVPDLYSANYKIKTLIFPRLVTQQTQYILGNGVKLTNMKNKEKLGKNFDFQLQMLEIKAIVGGTGFGFWNLDHLEVFSFADTPTQPGFCPLYSEGTAELMGGIRFWSRQVGNKMLYRYTLYETDGYTEYRKSGEKDTELLKDKQPYKKVTTTTAIGGVESVAGENYGTLPIIPLYANTQHQSELVGIKEAIDAYDFIKSGFANEIDDSSGFYWLLKNAGGMDDVDITKFIQRVKRTHAVVSDSDDDGDATAQTLNISTDAREKMLDRLEKDIYKDFQVLDLDSLTGAQKTAQELQTAYQPMDNKCAFNEYFLLEFMDKILNLAGLPNEEASFTWNKVVNQPEQTDMILNAASYLSDECVISHLPFLTPEEIAEEIEKRAAEQVDKFGIGKQSGKEDDESEDESDSNEDDDQGNNENDKGDSEDEE
jgi:hypothetical protein